MINRKIFGKMGPWIVKKNEVELQRAEMRMVIWMCDVKVKDRVPSN